MEGPEIEVVRTSVVQQLGFSALWLADNIVHTAKMETADLMEGSSGGNQKPKLRSRLDISGGGLRLL